MCRIWFVELWGVTVNVQDTVCGVVGSQCQCFIKQMSDKRKGHIHVNKPVQNFWNIFDTNEYMTRDTHEFMQTFHRGIS